jgi:hypothetical protein
MDAPASNGHDGRDARGPFLKGNKAGRGNPFSKRSAAIRSALLNAISTKDLQVIVRTLVEKAKAGDLVAAKLILLWAIGRPDDQVHPDGIARLVAAEAQAADLSPPLPDDHEARMALAARALAEEIRALRGVMPAPGGVGVPALEDRD